MLGIRQLVAREILPPGASDDGGCIDSFSGKYLLYFPAVFSRLIQQGEGLKAFSSQLAVVE